MSFMKPQFTDETIEIENEEGRLEKSTSPWHWRLSAPGYLDCTDWSPAESLGEAVENCFEMYGDSFDDEDYEVIRSCLEGFNEFFMGYIQSLGWTGHIQDKEGDEPSPLFEKIGDDICFDEVYPNISKDDQMSLLGDALDFFVSASKILPTDFDDWKQAGHDFNLTRNRHGAGFWDRGDEFYSSKGRELTELSHPYGTCEILVQDDVWTIIN